MKWIKQIVNIIQEDIIGTENRLMAVTWAACLAGVLGLGIYLSSESVSFLGVADSRELQVSFEYPVGIERVHVIPGQVVEKGNLLIELSQSELDGRIRASQTALSRLRAEMKLRQHLNSLVSNSASGGTADPLAVEIEDMNQEIIHLEEQRKNLSVFAEVSGVIGQVNFKEGETAPSFSTLITMSPQNPTYVQGFIHENLHSSLEVGRKVKVTSVSASGAQIEGHIVSVGARIVAMPARLLHTPMATVWGREVVVEIPSNNTLLLGEKVQLKPKVKLPFIGLSTAIAETPKAATNITKLPQEIKVPVDISRTLSFEPSGLVYLEDLKKFLVVSDDTDDENTPYVFLMDQEGKVESRPLRINGIDQINDMESVSNDGQMLYLMTSLKKSKKSDNQAAKGLFARAKRTELHFSNVETMDLKTALLDALAQSKDSEIQEISRLSKDGNFEVESHFVKSNDLYIGLKFPVSPANISWVLKITDVDAMFLTGKVKASNISVWKRILFPKDNIPHHLTDMILVNNELYVSTDCEEQSCGAVWLVDAGQPSQARLIQFFPNLSPEGIAIDPRDSTLFVTFEQKQSAPMYIRIPLKAPKAYEK
ncbi:MAG: efflux RND transporter periplasmic adaptor subunit [Bdellovibrionota bacterium]